ncbi:MULTISPECIES: M20/M25/M40 family metallo-hydrolase [unclassified Duganella]|uniref:M20/M25/M40 family metallo-hydrolase n=1 Tax=unclassified Duganella TaxID=2636909 RepID=UPI0008889ABE|nr:MULTISPECIES: M20/M25/M40 family metallo-hydrolase [unclassified Duganella]SDF98506.1 glutamate carboxypeptidase [Duganella sp. OV458]SDJ06285.1 glutamate carboxypeptidase [Duganella sp. OV510]
MKLQPLAFAILTLALGAARAEGLSPAEQKIVAEVKAHSAQGLALLEQSVNINSGTMNHEGVRAVGKLFGEQFAQLGFATRWSEMPPAMQRAGHLVATREGKQGKRLLLIGHLDTVFEKDSPVQLWQRIGDRVRGQGVNDMKGGDVIIIEALRALHRVGALDNTSITVVFTGDEENAGEPIAVSRADMVNAAKRSDIALAFEATVRDKDGRDTGTIGRRAASSWELKVSGKQGHSSGIFSDGAGYGAIYEAARIIDGFRQQVIEPDLTFSPGLIVGGTDAGADALGTAGQASGKSNVIARTATVEGDLRYLSFEQRDRAHAKMKAIVAQHLPGTSASISFRDAYPPMSPSAGNLAVLKVYSQASKDAGLGEIPALPPGQRGAGDVQFVAPLLDSLDGLGATGNGAHSPDEDLEIASIERATIRTAILLYRLTR